MRFSKEEQVKKKGINLFPKVKTRGKIMKEIDAIFSKMVKDRDDWTCQRCATTYDRTEKSSNRSLQCSHFFPRQLMGTRFELDNLDALCAGCHMRVESDKMGWYMDYMIEKLGPKKYEALKIKAYGECKMSKQDLELLLNIYKICYE